MGRAAEEEEAEAAEAAEDAAAAVDAEEEEEGSAGACSSKRKYLDGALPSAAAAAAAAAARALGPALCLPAPAVDAEGAILFVCATCAAGCHCRIACRNSASVPRAGAEVIAESLNRGRERQSARVLQDQTGSVSRVSVARPVDICRAASVVPLSSCLLLAALSRLSREIAGCIRLLSADWVCCVPPMAASVR